MTQYQNLDLINLPQLIEQLKCPVCLDIPEDAVYQCTEGHTICKLCYFTPGMDACPICRRSYFSADQHVFRQRLQIRSRRLETVLDSIRMECPNLAHGCEARLSRGEIKFHRDNCVFRQTSKLCRKLGFNCDFEIHRGDIDGAMNHFKNVHEFREFDSPSFGLLRFNPVFNDRSRLTAPRLVKLEDARRNPHLFIVFPKLSYTQGHGDLFSLSVVQVGNFPPGAVSGFNAKFTILGPGGKICNLKHCAFPQNFFNCDNPEDKFSPRYPAALLREHYLQGEKLFIDLELRSVR